MWSHIPIAILLFHSDRTGMSDPTNETAFQVPGFTITPDHGQLTIPKGLRFYPANKCKDCDPLTYTFEGRVNATLPWILIASGEIPGVADGLDRNLGALPISSTYESGDLSLSYASIKYHTSGDSYLEYRLSFPQSRQNGKSSSKCFC